MGTQLDPNIKGRAVPSIRFCQGREIYVENEREKEGELLYGELCVSLIVYDGVAWPCVIYDCNV